MRRITRYGLVRSAVLLLALLVAGCDDEPAVTVLDLALPPIVDAAAPPDTAVSPDPDLAPAPPDLGCYGKPLTHLELLNACTNAQAFDKVPVTPLLGPNGTLPPLP